MSQDNEPTRDDLLGALMVAHDALEARGAGVDDDALIVVKAALGEDVAALRRRLDDLDLRRLIRDLRSDNDLVRPMQLPRELLSGSRETPRFMPPSNKYYWPQEDAWS